MSNMKYNLLLFIFFLKSVLWIKSVEAKEKYPKYLVTYRNNTFTISNKPYLVDGNNKNEYRGKCFVTQYKLAWDEGTVYYPSDACKRMTCLENSQIKIEHCGAVTVEAPCHTHRLGDGQYPYCCWIFKCKSLDNKEYFYNPLTPYEGFLEEE